MGCEYSRVVRGGDDVGRARAWNSAGMEKPELPCVEFETANSADDVDQSRTARWMLSARNILNFPDT